MKKITLAFLLLTVMPSSYASNSGHDLTFSAGFSPQLYTGARQLEDTVLPYASLGFNLTENWGFETYISGGKPNRRDSGRTASYVLFLADAVYHFTGHEKWQPFIMGGAGFMYLNPNGAVSTLNPNGDESKAQANLNVGAGIEYFLKDNFSFRADVRDVLTLVRARNDILFNLGISYRFHLKKIKITEDSI